MFRGLFEGVSERTKNEAVVDLISRSSPRQDFFFLMTLSVLMATFGLLIESSAIVIGSMLITPMLYPVLSIALGITMSDYPLIVRSISTVLKSIGFGLAAAIAVTLFFAPAGGINYTLFFGTQPSLIDAAVAVIAGLAASFAMVKKMNETLPGVAISVALIPPLANVGIGIARFEWQVVRGSSLIFATNVLGVIFAATIIFSVMNFYKKRKVADEAVKEEQKTIAEIAKKTEEKAREEKKITES